MHCFFKNLYMRIKRVLLPMIALLLLTSSAVLYMKYRQVQFPEFKSARAAAGEIEGSEEENGEKEATMNEARIRYEFDLLKDPRTGIVPAGINVAEMSAARLIPLKEDGTQASGSARTANLNTYTAAGPNNIGGRTRAVAFDKRYGTSGNQVIMAGSVSGGIFRTTDGGANWTRVTPENILHNVTAIAQDPRSGSENVWYAGGGESLGNSAAGTSAFYFGYGILKSTDNGATWSQLTLSVINTDGSALAAGTNEAFDNVFDLVHKIVVSPVNGYVYICGHRRLVRSTDGGTTFNVVFAGAGSATSSNGQMDIAVSSAGRLVLAVNGGFPDIPNRGVWTSTTGALNSWTRIAGGQTAGVDSLNGWQGNSYTQVSGSYTGKRIVLALAPSSQNILYVLYENGLSQLSANGARPEADLYKIDLSNNSYTNLSAYMPDFPGQKNGVDPFAVQGGYDLMVTVKPDNPNMVFVGGSCLYRSANGFVSTASTEWIGGYNKANPPTYDAYPGSHPDQHNLVFDPSNANRALSANDGGLQVTADITATPVSWTMTSNYQTLQYYKVALDPTAGQSNFIGGAQDNGCYLRRNLTTPNNHFQISSGDGSSVGIASISNSAFTLYFSTAQGNISRDITNAFTSITPSNLTANPDGGFGDFLTNFKLDFDNPENLYYANFNRLFRTTSASTVSSSSWQELTGVASAINPSNSSGTNISISTLETSRGSYQTTHVLYIGTSNAKLYRLDDPVNAAPTAAPADITPTGLAGNISDIAVNPNNDAEVLVTVSNYGAVGMWYTANAKSTTPTWKNVEGNLILPSIRSCMIVTKKNASNVASTEYYVGTSVGLYSTTDISASTVNWVREGGNVLNYAIITSMDYRPQDNTLLLGTHGNGMYYASVGTANFTPDVSTGINTPVRNDRNFIVAAFPTISSSQISYRAGTMFTVKKLSLHIQNTAGQIVYNKEAGYANGTIDISNLARGIYVLSITSSDNKQQYITKFMKE